LKNENLRTYFITQLTKLDDISTPVNADDWFPAMFKSAAGDDLLLAPADVLN